jgi:rubrerythrin
VDWPTYFACNRVQRLPIPWGRGVRIAPRLRAQLAPSLQRYQLGERGNGTHLLESAAATGDAAFLRALELFIAEEQEHARLLERLLRAMGARPLRSHWSERCFTWLRRRAGLRVELMVLFVAEIVGQRYYQEVYAGTRDPVLRRACAQILHDEAGHLAFHCDSLRRLLAPLPRLAALAVQAGWRGFFRTVALVATYDHRAALRGLGLEPVRFFLDCCAAFDAALEHITGGSPTAVTSAGYRDGRTRPTAAATRAAASPARIRIALSASGIRGGGLPTSPAGGAATRGGRVGGGSPAGAAAIAGRVGGGSAAVKAGRVGGTTSGPGGRVGGNCAATLARASLSATLPAAGGTRVSRLLSAISRLNAAT